MLWTSRTLISTVAAVALIAGCGGSDSDDSTGDVTTNAPPNSAESDASDTDAEQPDDSSAGDTGDDESADAGAGSATLTMDDGTIYEFEMSSCETSNNSDVFLVDPGYDLFGRTSDDFRLTLIRAAFEEPANAIGDLGGDFDENGVNPGVFYTFRETDSTITLDGDTVTAELMMSNLGGNPIHGEESPASLIVTC